MFEKKKIEDLLAIDTASLSYEELEGLVNELVARRAAIAEQMRRANAEMTRKAASKKIAAQVKEMSEAERAMLLQELTASGIESEEAFGEM